MIQQELDFGFPDTVKIPDGAVFVRKDKWCDTENFWYFLSQKDTGKMIVKTFLDIRHIISIDKWVTHTVTERHQKFYCVNGTSQGQFITEEEGKPNGYERFINANRHSKGPRNVLVKI